MIVRFQQLFFPIQKRGQKRCNERNRIVVKQYRSKIKLHRRIDAYNCTRDETMFLAEIFFPKECESVNEKNQS